jgi:hypothetical protein
MVGPPKATPVAPFVGLVFVGFNIETGAGTFVNPDPSPTKLVAVAVLILQTLQLSSITVVPDILIAITQVLMLQMDYRLFH